VIVCKARYRDTSFQQSKYISDKGSCWMLYPCVRAYHAGVCEWAETMAGIAASLILYICTSEKMPLGVSVWHDD